MLCKRSPTWNNTPKYRFVEDFEVMSATIENKSIYLNLEDSTIIDNGSMSNKIRIRLDTISYSTELKNRSSR